MSYHAWTASIAPKVHGTLNLHELMPPNLDFFVLYTSATGVLGQAGGANYAAGNTFQDAFARHHSTSYGMPTTALALGIIPDEGVLAADPELLAHFRRLGH